MKTYKNKFVVQSITFISLVAPMVAYAGGKPLHGNSPPTSEHDKPSTNDTTLARNPRFNSQKLRREVLLGGAAGVVEVSVNMPIDYTKTCLQKGNPIQWRSPRAWYQGYSVSAGSMGPITALQMGTYAALTSMLADTTEGELTEDKKIFAGFLSGVLASLVSSPTEKVKVLQQGGSGFYAAAQELWSHGRRSFFRGFLPTAARDGQYTSGMIAVAPLAKRQLLKVIDDEFYASLAGSITTGVGVTLATQPWDMIKTTMQAGGNDDTVRDTVRKLYKEGGVVQFWSGSVPRGIRVVLAITLINEFQRRGRAYMEW